MGRLYTLDCASTTFGHAISGNSERTYSIAKCTTCNPTHVAFATILPRVNHFYVVFEMWHLPDLTNFSVFGS